MREKPGEAPAVSLIGHQSRKDQPNNQNEQTHWIIPTEADLVRTVHKVDFGWRLIWSPAAVNKENIQHFNEMEILDGGDRGIRTLDRALQPYNGLANRRLQPLGHVSA